MSYHVFLVPGSWHTPAHFETTIAELKSRGVEASTLLFPTCNLSNARITDLKHPDLAGPPPEKPWPNMYADATAIQSKLTELVDAGKLVLVAPHSYGGLPASEALIPELTEKSRKAAGKSGGVIGMFAIASYFLPPGVSTMMAVGGKPLPTTPEQPSGLHICLDPAANLLNDLPPKEQDHWVSLMRPQSWSVHETPATNAGFLNVPCGYLKTLNDVMTPVAGQQMGIDAARGFGATIAEYEVNGSHDAFLGHTKDCVDALLEFGQKCIEDM